MTDELEQLKKQQAEIQRQIDVETAKSQNKNNQSDLQAHAIQETYKGRVIEFKNNQFKVNSVIQGFGTSDQAKAYIDGLGNIAIPEHKTIKLNANQKKLIGVVLIVLLFVGLFSFFRGESLMTQALDPFTGNKEKINKWRDIGGLNSDGGNIFHGIKIESISYRFENGTEPKRMRSIEGRAYPEESPEKIRKALSKACRISESNFQIASNGTSGTAKSEDISVCHYEGSYIVILRGNGL